VPSAPLRKRLFLLVAAAILPVAAMSGIGLRAVVQQQRAQADRVGLELARALATAVDAELRGTTSVLESLATATTLDRGDLAAFMERAHRILERQPSWAAVMLADPSAQRIADTRLPPGARLPPIAEPESFEAVVRTRAAVVGNLLRGVRGEHLFAVRVPVVRHDELRYVLTALVKPEAMLDVIRRQRVPDDWVISIFDAHGRRVARSRAHAETLGGEAAASLQALMASGAPEGIGQTYALEGDRIYTAYSRIQPGGWVAAPGIPAALVEGAVYRSLVVYGGGILLSVVVGLTAAVGVARSITRPIAAVGAAAQSIGRAETPEFPETSIREIRAVADVLATAGTELRRAAAERERLLSTAQEAREAAEAANRTKDEFLAVLSHELRTPLNAVYGWARMLRAGQLPEDAVGRALEAIERNANAQVQLIDDLLDVSRVASGKMRLDVRPVDLTTVIEAALDAVKPAADAKRIRLQTVLDPRAGTITGDPNRLQQVVWNLLMNAVKFTPRSGRVQIHLQRVNSHVQIVVSDTGQGIAPDVLPFIFDRFRQADSSTTRAQAGLGLGLALVKHLVELHGGSVAAQSSGENKGTTFVVTLPVALAEVRVPADTTALERSSAGTRLDGVRVLVVDDDAEARDLAAVIISGAGGTVRTCTCAPDGLEALRQWRPDVLVSDIEMPGEDGYSLIRKVRALDAAEGGQVPAVALTAYGRVQDRIQSLTAGYSMHVPKPVDPGELTTIIASLARRAA
jgi:signal transduction histidine kinase/ActR/RegA family two-component response regulator